MKTVLNKRWAQCFLMAEVTVLFRHKDAELHTNYISFWFISMHYRNNSTKEYFPMFSVSCSLTVQEMNENRVPDFFFPTAISTEVFEAIQHKLEAWFPFKITRNRYLGSVITNISLSQFLLVHLNWIFLWQ